MGVAAYPIAVVVVIGSMILVTLLAYLLPVAIAAGFRLHPRDLGLLLTGSGWSVNTRMYLTRDVEKVFTQVPGVPRSLRGD